MALTRAEFRELGASTWSTKVKAAQTWLIPALVGAAALAVYGLTLAPGLTWAHAGTDGGDLVTAAAVGGVPHPPGYPTYILLGHLFARLPLGSTAFGFNLLSALAAALAAALITASVLRCIPPSRAVYFSAWIAGSTVAFGPMLWGQATIAEVHALNACFVAALCFIALPYKPAPDGLWPAARIGLGLLWGLGLGNALTLAALAPIVLPALWAGARGRWIGFAALALGLGIYALIPIRANAQPAINWGDARSLPNFIWLVSGGLYQGYVGSAPLELVGERLLSLPRLWLEQLGWIGAVWIGWGFSSRFQIRRAAPVILSVLLYIAFAIGYNTADSDLYLIPVWLLSAGYLGLGLGHILGAQPGRLRPVAVGAMATLSVVAMLATGWHSHDLRQDRTVDAFAEQALLPLPLDAILVTHADAHTFSLWYYRLAAGWRPDVSIVDARLAGYAWYEPMLIAQGSTPLLPADRTEAGLVNRLMTLNPTRPVCDLVAQLREDGVPTPQCQ
ncbi:MAG TPA: DUF2723 domain-containing protein [Anaerolineae bacterium]|nr:DUF2723 domain-containing protein [Anaerolineae bacterium]